MDSSAVAALAAKAAAAIKAANQSAPALSKTAKKKEKAIKKKLEKVVARSSSKVAAPSSTATTTTATSKDASKAASKDTTSKDTSKHTSKHTSKPTGSFPNKQNLDSLFLSEIKHFGGDKDDLDLIKDVDSDEEWAPEEDETGKSKKQVQEKPQKKTLLDQLGHIPNLVTKKDAAKKPGRVQDEDDSEIAKALQAFMTQSLKMDPKKSVVPVVSEAEVLQEVQELAAAEGANDSDDDNEDEDDSEDDDENNEPAAPIQPEQAETSTTQQRQKGIPQPKSDPAVAARINQLLNSSTFTPSSDSASSVSLSKKDAISKLIFEPTSLWHAVELPPVKPPKVYSIQDEALILKMYERAKALYTEEVAKYEQVKFQSASDRNFIKTVLKSGTTTDKISALTLLIQESPLHTLHYLRDQIIHGMARKKSRRDAIVAVDAVKDLMTGGVLPDRKLKYFRDQGVLMPGVTPVHLVVWYFEDSLKRVYFEFLQLIEELSKDPLTHIKSKTLTYLTTLLVSKPESEASLLALLVNKLGDASNPLAFKAAYLLQSQLLVQHPNMTLVVVKEVERLLVRSKGAARARYNCLSFLSQVVLRRDVDLEVARVLVGIYFEVFEGIVEGLKRGDGEEEGGKKGKKGKEVAGKKKGKKSRYVRPKKKGKPLTAEQAEAAGGEVVGDSEDEEEEAEGKEGGVVAAADGEKRQMQRVVEGIDAKTMAVLLTGVNRAFPYAQMDDEVFNKHMDTLFKISHLGTFNISIQALTLIFQVHSSRQTVSDRFYCALYDTLIDSRLPSCSKHPMYLNLLHRALKADTSLTRLRAFIKRTVQACVMSTTPFICGALFLIGDIIKSKPGLWSLVTMPEEGDEERFQDREVDESGIEIVKTSTTSSTSKDPTSAQKYDGRKRNPLYCNADLSCLWELTAFSTHFHPTVSLYAQTLLSGNPITIPETATAYDPLQNHTLARFLDRFVFKNPKKVTSAYRGSSLMQARPPGMSGGAFDADGVPMGNLIAGARKRGVIVEEEGEDTKVAMDDEPVNSAVWLNRKRENVPVDELFFYDFFKDKKAREASIKKKKVVSTNDDLDSSANLLVDEDDEGDDDDGGAAVDGDDDAPASDQDLDDDEVWDAMQRSSGKGGDDGDDDPENDDDFDMEAALADESFGKRPVGSDDEDEEFSDSDFKQFEEDVGEVVGEDEDDDDGFEDIDEDEEEEESTKKGKKSKNAADDDDDADELGMLMGEEDDDVDSDEDEVQTNKAGQKVGKPRLSKVAKLAEAAKKLGYKGAYFDKKLGKKGSDDMDDFADLGDGFASMDDFAHLIARDDEEEDTGAFDEGEKKTSNLFEKGVGKKRKVGGKPSSGGASKKFKKR